ncbi:glycosyltransferase family 2 protein [Ktedonosporobacter rubrisoli]|uniref:Glycosyltransferase family 2 protein n=1 Tax=Ktedonosporobacter rubrisoli TaxID=2509675 RepID=A0A4P6K4J6_KTERU|nr:glycosyltransferase family 2 protein [Ktedonosporobacter rubrisoli]QBD83247.1 glycosyltransferase family 2 protein [Ktedonosporobacter rubrisoli]
MPIDKVPIYCLRTNPKNWLRASLLKFKLTAREILEQASLPVESLKHMPWSERYSYLHSIALRNQANRWENTTGIAPADSGFSLIIPVHNEEHSLPSFLSTLLLADLPSAAHINIIFIANACNDASGQILDNFLFGLGKIEMRLLQDNFHDQLLNPSYKAVSLDNVTFMHLDTQTPGKGHALRTGNSLARSSGHSIAMCIDANDYIEPDAIRLMFGAAIHTFRNPLAVGDAVILSGMGYSERRVSWLKRAIDMIESKRQHLVNDTSGYILGCLMAWNTEWLHSIGNPLGIALEDYAMGVLARAHGYRIGQVKEAIIWSYGVNTFTDLLETRSRYVRGMLQLLYAANYAPSTQKIVEQDSFFMRNLRARLHHLLQCSRMHPLNFPKYLATFFLWEYALVRGKRDFRRNPTNPTWKKIASTR